MHKMVLRNIWALRYDVFVERQITISNIILALFPKNSAGVYEKNN